MATTILLTLLVTLAQARLTPLLPPLVPRDPSPTNPLTSLSHKTTSPIIAATRNYNTVAYKVYIAFMIFGTISAALMLPVVYSPHVLHWWRQKKHQKAVTQRKQDVAEATTRMRRLEREMTQPKQAYVRPERAVRPGSNWI